MIHTSTADTVNIPPTLSAPVRKIRVCEVQNIMTLKDGFKGTMILERNVVNDSYRITLKNPIKSKRMMAEPEVYLSVNGKVIVQGTNDPVNTMNRLFGHTNEEFVINSSSIGITMADTNIIYAGIMLSDYVVYMHKIVFSKQQLPEYTTIKAGETLSVMFNTKLTFETERPISIGDPDKDTTYSVERERLNLVTKKIEKLDRYSPVQELCDIYLTQLDDRIGFIMNNDVNKVSSSTFQNLTGYIGRSKEIDYNLNGFVMAYGNFEAKYSGTVMIGESSYYDYEKAKSVIGYKQGSSSGELIPYNYEGEYSWKINLSLWDVAKNLTVVIKKDVGQPILDEYSGRVILNVENEINSEAETNYSLNIDGIKMLQELDKNISLTGLKRISHEKAR